MQCPKCGTPDQTGRFCAECGSALASACPSCGASLEPDDRYCPSCGARVPAQDGNGAGSHTRWIIAGVAVAVVALVLFLPGRTERAGPRTMTGSPEAAPLNGGMGGSGGMGGFTGDMRADADRLFNRIMTAAELGNEAEVAQFMPMAVQAYGAVPDLNDDGLFHLAILHQTAGNHAEARATAGRILEGSPDHILALGVAGSSAAEQGDDAEAIAHYRRLVDRYDAEARKSLPEYVDHEPMLAEYRRLATEFLAGR